MGEGQLVEGTGCPETFATCMRAGNILGLLSLCVIAVLACIDFEPRTISLNAFMVLFSLLGLCAELRTTKCLAGFGYFLVQYYYFVNTYTGRGIFYILVGSCNLDTEEGSTFRLVVSIYLMVVGLLTVFCGCSTDVPKYIDAGHVEDEAPKPKRNRKAEQQKKDHPYGYNDAEEGYEKSNQKATRGGIPNVYDTYKNDDEYERNANERKREQEEAVKSKGGIVDVYASRDRGYEDRGVSQIANPYEQYESPVGGGAQGRGGDIAAPPPAGSSAGGYGNYALDDDDDGPKRKNLDDDDEIERAYYAGKQ